MDQTHRLSTVAQTSGLPYRRLAACGSCPIDTFEGTPVPLHKPRPSGRKPVILQTGVLRYDSAAHRLLGFGIALLAGAAPRPGFRRGTKSGCDGIVANVTADARFLHIVANPVVERFALPKSIAGTTEQFVRFPRSEALPTFQDVAQELIRHRPHHDVNVIGHHHPFAQFVALAIEVHQSLVDQRTDLRFPQMTLTCSLVEIPLHFTQELAVDLLALLHSALRGEMPANGFGPVPLELHEHFAWQRIRETEGHEVSGPLALYMRQVAPAVDARSKRVLLELFFFCPIASYFKSCAIEARVVRSRRAGCHVATVPNRLSARKPVEQTAGLLYRRSVTGCRSASEKPVESSRSPLVPTVRRLQACDTADRRSALLSRRA